MGSFGCWGHVGLSLWESQSLWNLLLLGLSQNGQVSRETKLRSGLRFRTSAQLPLAPPWTVLKAPWTDGSLREGVFSPVCCCNLSSLASTAFVCTYVWESQPGWCGSVGRYRQTLHPCLLSCSSEKRRRKAES